MDTHKIVRFPCKYCNHEIEHELCWKNAVLHIVCNHCKRWNYLEFKNYIPKIKRNAKNTNDFIRCGDFRNHLVN